jgi:hypothetical protein
MAQQALTQIYHQPGWVEHDPQEIWTSQLATARQALQQAGIGASDIASLGITNQRETTVVWRRDTGQAIYNGIVWQDRRAEPECLRLREAGAAPMVQQKTGLLIDAYFSATKLQWILNNVTGARAMAERGEYDALVALGCIIRGETYHFELVANESGAGVSRISIDYNVPIANAILTTENMEQAIARQTEKGRDAARVAVEMAMLLEDLSDGDEDLDDEALA